MSQNVHNDRVLILDFGSQYSQLIARRVRELGVYCELMQGTAAELDIRTFNPLCIILSGGPESATHKEMPKPSSVVFELGVPVLGICYGMQVMCHQLGGAVDNSSYSESGKASVQIIHETPLFKGLCDRKDAIIKEVDVWMSHGDQVKRLPNDFVAVAQTEGCPIAAMTCEAKKLYGVQFHPEVTHTPQGQQILKHFICDISGANTLWLPESIVTDIIINIREQVGTSKVLLALSGGVDSSVAGALLARAIGDKLTCVFVDNGLLRLNEGDQLMAQFDGQLGMHVVRIDAQKRFLEALEGVVDPEEKRRIIGHTFIEVFEEVAEQYDDIPFLAQGTIYPDVIESAGLKEGKAHVIKSHHNVGGLPSTMKMTLVEPLKELFKDEVRKIGQELDLPDDILFRHPFPGPGLGVRILGEVLPHYLDILRAADDIFIEELKSANLYNQISQAFAVFLPVKSVGVVGDMRRYGYVISLRAVETIDFMTAHSVRIPWEFLERVSSRIINEVDQVARVTYDISSKPPATIEWE